VAAGGDVNGDGTPDLVVGAPGMTPKSYREGRVYVLSPRHLRLASDTHAVSIASIGTQRLDLDLGAPFARQFYLLLGSASGIKPGLSVGSVHLPLNLDAYLLFTAATSTRCCSSTRSASSTRRASPPPASGTRRSASPPRPTPCR
jgi:hypothetical protein